MATSFDLQSAIPRSWGRGAASKVTIAIIAGSTVFGLLIGATTFGALAIAFPLAVPIAQQFEVSVSPHDMLVAEQLAQLWPVFAFVAIWLLAAAAAVVVKSVSYLETDPRE